MTINLLATEFVAKYRRLPPRKARDHRPAQRGGVRRRSRRARWLTVRVRPIRPDDGPLLNDVFAQVRYLTDVDHRNHEALIAITRRQGEAVGVARFVRDPQDPTTAEVAMSVVDEWQNRGVGSMLATRLSAGHRIISMGWICARESHSPSCGVHPMRANVFPVDRRASMVAGAGGHRMSGSDGRALDRVHRSPANADLPGDRTDV